MGRTNASPGRGGPVVAVAGNPNVGKSTLFNALTGLRQHTGNWSGKTVATARGRCDTPLGGCTLVDVPGAYSLAARSAEEEVARDFICFGGADATLVVCDATCLERSLILALQVIEAAPRALVCVNLLDEAEKKGVRVDLPALGALLGVPVTGAVARDARGLDGVRALLDGLRAPAPVAAPVCRYAEPVEAAVGRLSSVARAAGHGNPRFLCLELLAGEDLTSAPGLEGMEEALAAERRTLAAAGWDEASLREALERAPVAAAESICARVVTVSPSARAQRDRKIDRVLTGRWTAYPAMLALLALTFYITLSGANAPSRALSRLLLSLEAPLHGAILSLGAPMWAADALAAGAYRTLSWVVAVMLPPMAIFFPLFTLLEDVGYLPRVAYNLDRPFCRCHACGKQALTLCMGFGCNAVGVVGCRIIDSPRERLAAILTNCFVPCNGRFPTLILLLSLYLMGTASSLVSALLLTLVVALGVLATFGATWVLTRTVLRGESSAFTLELPPYRAPRVMRVLVRSALDRTLYVLGRAASVAAPAGLLIWMMANVDAGGVSILGRVSGFLDPFARLFGLDGVLLTAFLLGFPANEIVLPIAVMAYTAQGGLAELGSIAEMRVLLEANGWTPVTAVCCVLFTLMHWPCSTTLLTIRRETGSFKWTLLALVAPTAAGLLACFLTARVAALFG